MKIMNVQFNRHNIRGGVDCSNSSKSNKNGSEVRAEAEHLLLRPEEFRQGCYSCELDVYLVRGAMRPINPH